MTISAGSDEISRADTSTDEYFREWWAVCERDVVHLQDASKNRSLSKGEVNSGRAIIEIMARLEANQKKRGWWYRIKRRGELMQRYFKIALPNRDIG